MNTRSVHLAPVVAALATAAALGACGGGDDDSGGKPVAAAPGFSRPGHIDNPYLPLTKYRTCVLEGRAGAARSRIVRRLLDRTEPFEVGGTKVPAVVVEDRDYEDGELVERTLDYFAQADDGTVQYLGEDVDEYEGAKVTGHGGAWRYGRDTRTLGVLMPPKPEVGSAWRGEDVPGVTVESDRVVERLPSATVRGRIYTRVIRVREVANPGGEVEHKLYARGVGVLSERDPDGTVELVGCRS